MLTKQETKTIQNRMENLGEELSFTTDERKRLQAVFTDGTLSKNICWIGWVEYKDNNGKTHYTDTFSPIVGETMRVICEERIKNVEQSLEALYENYSLNSVTKYINDYIKELSKKEAHSIEWERLVKHASQSIASVENGKLNREDKTQPYDCIVVKQRGFYIGSLKINKQQNGYRIECRVPLGGDCSYTCDKSALFKELKNNIQYMLS